MRSSVLGYHWPLLRPWASRHCWKKVRSQFTWLEPLRGTRVSVTVLFSLVNIQNLFYALPSSFLWRGRFAFRFPKTVSSDLGPVISISLYYRTFLFSLNVSRIIVSSHRSFFGCGIFWFPALTLPLVPAPPLTGSSFLPSPVNSLCFSYAAQAFASPGRQCAQTQMKFFQTPFLFSLLRILENRTYDQFSLRR